MTRPLPDPNLPWPIPLAAVGLIADKEGLRTKAYLCPAGVWTLGWGETDGIAPGMSCTKDEADSMLCRSLTGRTARVRDLCSEVPSGNELGAMVSLHYNIGHEAFRKSTALRAHNRGDRMAAARAFGLFNKARVKGTLQVVGGLTARRAAEAALYLTPDDEAESPHRMPQTVAPESNLRSSPIAQGGTAAVAVGGISVLAEVNKHVGTVGTVATQAKSVIVDTLGIPSSALVPILLLIVGGVVIWQRFKQRIQGWA